MNWRVIFWGIVLQFIIAIFIFKIPVGSRAFLWVNDAVVKILNSASAGAKFVFGRLALPPGQINESGEESLGFILAFQAFPTIIFFSALISILYYLNIMQYVIRGFAYVFTKLMRISGAESLVAASEIFVGIESNLAVRPYLNKMTRSEICTVLTCGMATVASNVLALYVFSLRDVLPTIAGHLVTASLLAAPAAVVMSVSFWLLFNESIHRVQSLVSGPADFPPERFGFGIVGKNKNITLIYAGLCQCP
jgi:CNT family concentrative nucleoside transporter